MKGVIILICFFLSLKGLAQNSISQNTSGSSLNPEQVLQQYIRIPSESGNEVLAGAFFKDLCRDSGLFITEMGNQNGQYNFMASLFPTDLGKPNIILLNHIDVVPENEESLYGPYSGEIHDDNIYGRGAVDNKGVATMQLFALIRLKNNENYQNSPYNISLLTVSCEETQCSGGIQYVIKNYWDVLNPATVIGEGPSEIAELIGAEHAKPIFGISLAHKRAYWVELELDKPVVSHGSVTPRTYANKELVAALHRLTKKKQKAVFNEVNTNFLKQMAEYKKGFSRFVLKHPRFFKPFIVPQLRKSPEIFSIFSNTITLTTLKSSSETLNSNSAIATAGLDCRLLPDTDENLFKYELQKRLKNDSVKVKMLKSTPRNQSSSEQEVYLKNLKDAIHEGYPGSRTISLMMPNVNDLGYFRAKGVPCYGSMPIFLTPSQLKNIHGANENISIKTLNEGTNAYFIFLKKMIYTSPEDQKKE